MMRGRLIAGLIAAAALWRVFLGDAVAQTSPPGAIQQPRGTWQAPGAIQQPRGPWQTPGEIQVPKGIDAIHAAHE